MKNNFGSKLIFIDTNFEGLKMNKCQLLIAFVGWKCPSTFVKLVGGLETYMLYQYKLSQVNNSLPAHHMAGRRHVINTRQGGLAGHNQLQMRKC